MDLNKLKECLDAIPDFSDKLKNIVNQHNKILILGNGGSSSIASHIAQDYTRNLKKHAFTFTDSSQLTCYANDYSWEDAYKTFLSEVADQETLVILISSSGNSMNIVNCAFYCRYNKIPFITLSGFHAGNKLRRVGGSLLDFWVDSREYLIVEITHLVLLHSIIDEGI